ncbi:MAG: hypothetical protein JW932_08090 [Deltaproteobacteria bacterium]|nr:hypothetical protein [Deltaproteobacteria bacterium]
MALCFLGLLFACGGDDPAENPDNPSPADEAHTMGDVWAMAYPTSIVGSAADHTYLQGLDEDGRLTSWMCFGKDTDGQELADTRTDAMADLTVVEFMAAEEPCKWPITFYLRVGVCHQCANRGLYYTGKTVANATGYDFFVSIYGTYGEETEGSYSMEKCLAAAPPWLGPDILSLTIEKQMLIQDAQAGEIALYRQYIQQRQGRDLNHEDRMRQWRDYLDALFERRIRFYLGTDFPEQTIEALQAARNVFLDEKEQLDIWVDTKYPEPSEMMDRYGMLLNDLADSYKTLLTPDEYEWLFNLAYDTPVDLGRFFQQ